jgi:hypothetical protein
MNCTSLLLILLISTSTFSREKVDFSSFNKRGEARVSLKKNLLKIVWPAGKTQKGKVVVDLNERAPLFKSIQLSKGSVFKNIAQNLEPVFLLTIGKRDLISQNGWNIFFDKTNKLPSTTYKNSLNKGSAAVLSAGSRTIIRIQGVSAGSFSGDVEITFYNGSPLFNVAAVVSTDVDSTAILFDAGLVSQSKFWEKIAWSDTENRVQSVEANLKAPSRNLPVKYRAVIGQNKSGSLVLFPPPHQYFYPLDEAFNLKFTWYGNNYRNIVPGFGIGIRQDPMGDNRWVPWFNAPPRTLQRLNFFCLLSTKKPGAALDEVKKFTHNDSYLPLPGFKTMSSHFHNEFVMTTLHKKKLVPAEPNFVKVFKNAGINIVHLAEFHYTAHPKGPDNVRLHELHTLHEMCRQYSKNNFLLLPGEEPNEFFGGHWLSFFPKPVNWIMSKKPNASFVTIDPIYGKVYRVGNEDEMLRLLEAENGLAWTAHARTKGSTGFPDLYREKSFFRSKHFLGAAWKNMPADLSADNQGKRVLDLMDDMANWGHKKHVIAEADLFSVEPENEMYAHLNVNYLELKRLPQYHEGWKPVLDVIKDGRFFVTTGEVLLPTFTVNGKKSGETLDLSPAGNAIITLKVNWTFPLQFAEIISGDYKKVYRKRINLNKTKSFGEKQFIFKANLKNMKWVRVEVWDVATNGAFTQQVWLN